MKKKFLLFYMGLISFVCIAQSMETQYLNRQYQLTKKNRACFVREIKKVNDTLFTVTDFIKDEKIVMKGSYSSIDPMIENGEFQFFDKESNILASGSYQNGKMCGEWTFFKGSKIFKTVNYNFQTHTIDMEIDTASFFIQQESFPTFKNQLYENDFIRYLKNEKVYPPMAQKYKVKGTVVVRCVIDESGKIANLEVIRSVNKDLDIEALRIIAQSPLWTPARKGGKDISTRFTVPVIF